MQYYRDQLESPLGLLTAVLRESVLYALDYSGSDRLAKLCRRYHGVELSQLPERPLVGAIRDALSHYFEGDLSCLNQLPVWQGGSSLERSVWATLRQIPPGSTLSYGQLAAKVGHPKASRLVGRINGSNPIGIVVPCHRVIGASGALTGYSGGLERKAWLLDHEARHTGQSGASELLPTSWERRTYSRLLGKSDLS